METDLNETFRPWRQEYYTEIRALADEYQKQPEESREDWLHEAIDGHEFVIYTYKARCVLVATDNPTAWEDEFGERSSGPEQEAYAAMMADVHAAAGRLGDAL